MKPLLILVDSPQYEVVIAVIKVLTRIMRSEAMKETWLNFLELLLLKIIDCYKKSKEVSAVMFAVCDFIQIINPPRFPLDFQRN